MKLAISISSPSTQTLYHGHQSLATFVSIFMVTIAYRHHAFNSIVAIINQQILQITASPWRPSWIARDRRCLWFSSTSDG